MAGLITQPWAVPAVSRRTCPSSMTLTRSIARSSFRTGWSQTRSATPSAWAPRPPAMSYPAPGRLVVTAVGAGEGMTLRGKTEWTKWG
jgi:hypothetical protein